MSASRGGPSAAGGGARRAALWLGRAARGPHNGIVIFQSIASVLLKMNRYLTVESHLSRFRWLGRAARGPQGKPSSMC